MSKYEQISLLISTSALVAALVAIYFSVRTHRDRKSFDLEQTRIAAIEKARPSVETNVAKMNGLLNSAQVEGNLNSDVLLTVVKLNADTRDLYLGLKHHFSSRSREAIDKKLSEIESLFPKFANRSVDANDILTILSLSQLIQEKINDELQSA